MTDLVALLRCPECNATVSIEDAAACANGHRYPVVEGIPVFVDERAVAGSTQYTGQRAYFDAEFRGYRRYTVENWRAAYLARLKTAGVLDGEGPLVDVGVGGSGYTVIEAARRGRPAVGCDLSLTGLLSARRFAEAEGVADRTLWICCSAERVPLASAAFGSVLAIAVLEHVPDDAAAWRELARMLLPGGRGWVTVPHALQHVPAVFRRANRRHDRRLGHLRRYDARTLAGAAAAAGLEPVELQFTGHAVKVLQLVGGRFSNGLWWWCERRDQRHRGRPDGSMQLSAVLARP